MNVDSSFTSQYVSALMLASPLWEEPLKMPAGKNVNVSKPYVEMTRRMLEEHILDPEPDWSAAAFFYEYAFVFSKKEIVMDRLVPPAVSLQGDSVCCDLFGHLGVNTSFRHDGSAILSYDALAFRRIEEEEVPFEFDFSGCPDLVPAVAVALCYRRIPFKFHGVGHLKYKECDRLTVLQRLLVSLGYGVEADGETLCFNGEFLPYEEFPLEVSPYGDHRMAMAFYPLELLGMIKIEDKDVVSKSFPDFYMQFK